MVVVVWYVVCTRIHSQQTVLISATHSRKYLYRNGNYQDSLRYAEFELYSIEEQSIEHLRLFLSVRVV